MRKRETPPLSLPFHDTKLEVWFYTFLVTVVFSIVAKNAAVSRYMEGFIFTGKKDKKHLQIKGKHFNACAYYLCGSI